MLSEKAIAWLLDAPETYIRYQALLFLKPEEADPRLLDGDPFIRRNIQEVALWRDSILERHDKPDLFIHRLAMLADLGVTPATEGMRSIIDNLLANINQEGVFPIAISIPTAFGGTGRPSKEWLICDFPVVVYALLRMGIKDDRLEKAAGRLVELAGAEFYPCCGSIPKFKGPGPKGGMCPYANLLVARALALHPEYRKSAEAKRAAGAVLGHWAKRKEKKPFLFGMGTDFQKLKYPFVWYNLLHVLTALAPIEGVNADSGYQEMLELLGAKQDEDGRVKPESIYMVYKSEEWSNKKAPSRLLTIRAHQVLQRAGMLMVN
ncbi:MAG: hypothetical protein WCT14_03290 [Treponemataceae bacterium]